MSNFVVEFHSFFPWHVKRVEEKIQNGMKKFFRRTEHTNSINEKKQDLHFCVAMKMAEKFGSMCLRYICDIFCTNIYKLKKINCTTKTCAYIDEKSVYFLDSLFQFSIFLLLTI